MLAPRQPGPFRWFQRGPWLRARTELLPTARQLGHRLRSPELLRDSHAAPCGRSRRNSSGWRKWPAEGARSPRPFTGTLMVAEGGCSTAARPSTPWANCRNAWPSGIRDVAPSEPDRFLVASRPQGQRFTPHARQVNLPYLDLGLLSDRRASSAQRQAMRVARSWLIDLAPATASCRVSRTSPPLPAQGRGTRMNLRDMRNGSQTNYVPSCDPSATRWSRLSHLPARPLQAPVKGDRAGAADYVHSSGFEGESKMLETTERPIEQIATESATRIAASSRRPLPSQGWPAPHAYRQRFQFVQTGSGPKGRTATSRVDSLSTFGRCRTRHREAIVERAAIWH